MAMIWFTADTHAFHRHIIRYQNRPYINDIEMSKDLADKINTFVSNKDTLYHLGDFAFKKDKIIEFRHMLNCNNIYLIYGNHDKEIKRNPKLQRLFACCYDILDRKFFDYKIVMCHYAMKVWNRSHYGSFHLYGHSHGSLEDDMNAKSLDVGVDTCLFGHKKYTPYDLDEIVAIMNKKVFKPMDHHYDITTL